MQLLTNSGVASHSELSEKKSAHELILQLSTIDAGLLLYVLPAVCRDIQVTALPCFSVSCKR